MLLPVHPIVPFFSFFFFGFTNKNFWKRKTLFVEYIYIMNKDEETTMCKSDSMQAVA